MGRIHLTDRQWAFIGPLLPLPARTGRPHANDRRTIDGMLMLLDLPLGLPLSVLWFPLVAIFLIRLPASSAA